MLSKFVVFRYMDWASTNGNPVVTWADRSLPSHPSYSFGAKGQTGVPWEVCIDLANQAGRDMWINVPHQANDDYVTQLAKLFKEKLDPNLNLYLEYSNEVWNWGFVQATWNLDAAVAEVNGGDPNHLNYDNCNNKWYWGYRRVALRLKQITDAFAQVWGQDQILKRIKPVLAGQVVQPLICQLGLDYINAVFGAPNKWFVAIAGAPYYNLGDLNKNPNMTTNDVLNALEKSIDSMATSVGVGWDNGLAGHAALARWYNLEFRGYEGGPDTFGPNGIKAKMEATADPRMKDLTIKFLNVWYSYGFKPINWYSVGAQDFNTQYGSWGITDNMKNFNEPKILGIDAVRNAPTVALSAGFLVPGTLNATEFVNHRVPKTDPYLRWLGINATFDFLIRSPKNGQYSITAYTATTLTGSILQITVNNGTPQRTISPNTGDEEKFQPCPSVTAPFTLGLNVVRLVVLTARGYNIQSLQIQ